nr:MAG TPA: hypothetical protein [Caudoviricetes sp.]
MVAHNWVKYHLAILRKCEYHIIRNCGYAIQ